MLGLELLNKTGHLSHYLLIYEAVLVSAQIIFIVQLIPSDDLLWQIINCMDEYIDGGLFIYFYLSIKITILGAFYRKLQSRRMTMIWWLVSLS
jgi:hypothetical protein